MFRDDVVELTPGSRQWRLHITFFILMPDPSIDGLGQRLPSS
jgi:hypothetical protein